MDNALEQFPRISIVVPTYNRPAPLGNCLAALLQLDYPKDRYEVIVVDDGGSADLAPIIEHHREKLSIRLHRQSNAGPAAARNAGVERAAFEVIAFTDDDCLPQADWLRLLTAEVAKNANTLVGGVCRNAFPDNIFATASQTILDVVNDHFNRDPRHAIFFPSDNMAMSRAAFLEAGRFDPSFRCSEDRDLCDRWLARGWPIVLERLAIVDHARTSGLKSFIKQHFGYGRGAWRFHEARKLRQRGDFEVEGKFYLKCFKRPWQTKSPLRAMQLTIALLIWQLANTAGFFYESFKPARRLDESPADATSTHEDLSSHPEA